MGNFTPLGGNRKIPARRGPGSNLEPQAREDRTLGSRPPPPLVTHLVILVVVWVLKHFIDIIIGYKTTVYTNQSPSRNLSVRLVRRNITIEPYSPEIKIYLGTLKSRNIYVRAVTDT